MLEMLRQITQVDEVARSGDARAGNDVLQFAHIAWPGMLQQNGLRAPRQPGDVLSIGRVVFVQKKLNQEWNILEPLRQRRDTDLDGTQTVKKILAETPCQDFRAQ